MKRFDAIIIGSGQAANPLAKRLSKEGKRVALVEGARLGGTCINDGCTPTKTLVALAKVIKQARTALHYGLSFYNEVPDYFLVHQHTKQIVSAFRQRLESSLTEDPYITVYRGEAKFSGYKQIQVPFNEGSPIELSAPSIFINTGARAAIPNIEGLPSVRFYTSKTILELESLPKQLLIIGGGYIALEFAQIFRRMGSLVTIIERSARLLSGEDEDVGVEMTRILQTEGVQIITNATINAVVSEGDCTIRLEVLSTGKKSIFSGTHLLIATGRTPNTEKLALDKTNIQVDEKGFIPVNDHLQTKEPGIYALGDVKGGPAFTHVSYHDYIVLTEHLFGNKDGSIHNRLIPYCVFTDPELGRIGLTEKQAEEMGYDYSIAKMETSFIARAIESGETNGFLKAIVDNQTKRILGVSLICANGGELMSLFQIAMMGNISYDQLRDTMFAHPTYAEAINNLFSPIHLKTKV